VALYREPRGDEASYDDGVASACGLCDNWLYLELTHQAHVGLWLQENGVHLGNSDIRPHEAGAPLCRGGRVP
jgi:hypothetical protein